MDSSKLDTIREWPQPRIIYKIRSFLGLYVYYRRFIPDFANIANPLYLLIDNSPGSKHKSVRFNLQTETALKQLKEIITSNQVLTQPRAKYPFIIETDASDFGWDAQFLQENKKDEIRLVIFENRKFTPLQRNYPTHKRELLAIKESLKLWDLYINNGRTTIV